MKTTLKFAACLTFICIVTTSFAQQKSDGTKQTTPISKKKTTKSTKAIDNKIAVSDQAKPTEKSSKSTTARKDNGISNK